LVATNFHVPDGFHQWSKHYEKTKRSSLLYPTIKYYRFCIGLYQNFLIWHILPEAIAPCTAGVSCVDQPFVLFGFITIPLGSMISFAIISASMILYGKLVKEEKTVKNKSK